MRPWTIPALRLAGAAALALAALAAASPAAHGQLSQQKPPAQALERLLQAPYLTEQERADLRVFHGRWTAADVQDPARRARAALLAGVFDEALFADPAVDPLDRAEALLRAGEPARAIESLTGEGSARAVRLRAQALFLLGRRDEADAAIEPVVEKLTRTQATGAAELVEAVRALALRARIEGRPADDHHFMLQLLSQAREELDRLHWPALLAEAELLYDKDNRAEAATALEQALELNPRAAEAIFLRGQLAVDGFDFDTLERVVSELDQLDRLARGDPASQSVLGDLLEARRWLRQNEPALALEALAPALARLPHMPEALALQAAATAQLFQHDRAEALLRAFDERFPHQATALLAVGRALSEQRQYARAAELLQRAMEREPLWPAPMIELGLLYVQWGRDAEALRVLDRAVALDPFNVRAGNSLTLVRELQTYETIETPHFRIRHKPGVDRVMAVEMVEPLERIHQTVAGLFQHEPAEKTVVELHPNHRWFAVRITGMPGVHTIAAATGPVIAMEAPKVGPNHLGEYDWTRVVQHEYAHTVTLSRTNNRIPHWFTEAAAVYAEQKPRDYETVKLLVDALRSGELFDLKQINVAFVRPKKPTDRAQAYAQGHWMYEFIAQRFGESAPLELMDLYAKGVREEEAYQRVLGLDSDAFLRAFTIWATEQARAWGMLPAPSLQELLLAEKLRDPEGRSDVQEALRRIGRGVALVAAGMGPPGAVAIELPAPTEAMADRWLEEHPDNPAALEVKLTLAMERLGGPDASLIPLLERYATARPVDDMPHRMLAKLFLHSGDAAEALRAVPHLEYLDLREQRTPTYAVELAKLYAQQGDAAKALAKITRATQIAPFDATIRELAAGVAIQAGALDAAQRHIEALVAIEPDREIHRQRLERIKAMRKHAG